MRLPMGLVHAVLSTGGRLAAQLAHLDQDMLANLIRGTTRVGGVTVDTEDDERVDLSID